MQSDRLYKELIITCILEFVRFAAPALYEQMDPDTIEFQDKELFTDIATEETSEADVVVKAKVKGRDSFFIIHVENQATARPEFAERMFRYFAKLYGKHHLPVYPIAVLSFERPKREEPDRFLVEFPDLKVMEFHFRVIQLNRMDWRDYLHSDNPVAAALMTRMNVAQKDRPRVKLEALKRIATRRLDPARTQVLSWFVDSTLPLDAPQQREFEDRLGAEGMREKEAVMEMTTSWLLQGREQGREEGREEGREALADAVLMFLRRQVGALGPEQETQVRALSMERLGDLSKALLEFHTVEDLTSWLAHG